ncbi:P-loop containing nucleoside triphosphate hydrolase protein, partial [Chytriomyces sp. MP71]
MQLQWSFRDAGHELAVCGCRVTRLPLTRVRKLIASLLRGHIVSSNSVVSLLDGSLRLSITRTRPETGSLLVSPHSILHIHLTSGDSSELPHVQVATIQSSSSQLRPRIKSIPHGLERAYASLYDLLKVPLMHADLVSHLAIDCPKGVLLYGPPGVGKTMLVSTVARNCNAHLVVLNGSDVFGALVGESEERIRATFNEALNRASISSTSSCILFIDEIDSIAPNRNESSQSESRMVATLLTLMDGMKSRPERLIVVGATNRPNALDPALRRPGRFDREIAIDAPSEAARLDILRGFAGADGEVGKLVDDGVDWGALAVSTNGYVGADLAALWREAWLHCMESGREILTASDFSHALSITTPSTTRGHTVTVPANLTWNSVGGLEAVKQQLRQCVEWPVTRRDVFARLGLQPPRGVLLYGPPGCSKTTLVRVIAATSNATFLSINGAALYSPFVGDSEQTVRALFHRARLSSPSVIFLDEIDAVVGNRDLSGGGGGTRDATQEGVLSTLLNEMDGIEASKDVLVVGATNRPDMIDAALMRPGRFDKVIYV